LVLLNFAQNAREIRVAVKMTTHSVPGWLRHAKKQGLYVCQVANPTDPKNGKRFHLPLCLFFVWPSSRQLRFVASPT